ncbi:AraC family transcriptional regulator [Caldimonas brevitalea]|uniref:Transcriptional regulator, AraC family n=1 Tax=Caldimonas brevitalea TaxID=413882 RepID=A0A0G3BUR6_9BURK|nr:AraC family transcriptional regulator [Caldimonas brevitalea]AKJ31116.1 transcriptional regulator, AraC family [Caldimonas brevitalea]
MAGHRPSTAPHFMPPPGPDEPSVAGAYPALLLDIVAERGHDTTSVLEAGGLSASALAPPTAHLSAAAYAAMVLEAARVTGDPGIGLALGLRLHPSTHGFLGYALLTCRTLREAIELGMRYSGLRQRHLVFSLHVEADVAALEVRELAPMGPVRQILLEAMLAGAARALGVLLGAPSPGLALWFQHDEPPHFAAYREQLPAVLFGQSSNRMVFPSACLDAALPLHNRDAQAQAVGQCEHELQYAGVGGDADLPGWVQAQLELELLRPPALPQLAARLHLSERTLKRRLQAHGTSFQALLESARRRRALQLIAQRTLSVADIAALLGYQDPANFTRAFRRWTGRAPSEHRLDSGGTLHPPPR